MVSLTIRDLPEAVHRSLADRARIHNRTVEAEARAILVEAVRQPSDFVADWLTSTELLRGEFDTADRAPGRPIEL